MTQEEQRIAIAEACGYSSRPDPFYLCGRAWFKDGKSCGADSDLPDYLNDLNAMHEAEKLVFGDGEMVSLIDGSTPYWKYQLELSKATNAKDKRNGPMAIIRATAAQRAEAFLKTFGKWKD